MHRRAAPWWPSSAQAVRGHVMRPLEGVRVLDFSTLLPGPMASLLLAEAGAEVLKIERPGTRRGDARLRAALGQRERQFRAAQSRQEEHRRRPEGPGRRAIACWSWPRRADVVLEQFRPGVMDRLGLGYEAMRKQNPRIIYCAITGYGQSGPRRDRAGHDLNYIGDTGLLALRSGAAGRARGAAGADRRHRRRSLSRGDQHPAGAASARRQRRGRLSRHRHDRQPVHVRVLGDRQRPRRRAMAGQRHRPRHRRHAALSAVRDHGRPHRRRRADRAALLGGVRARRSGWSRSSPTTRAIRPPRRRASPRSSRSRDGRGVGADLRGGGLLLLDRAGRARRAGRCAFPRARAVRARARQRSRRAACRRCRCRSAMRSGRRRAKRSRRRRSGANNEELET